MLMQENKVNSILFLQETKPEYYITDTQKKKKLNSTAVNMQFLPFIYLYQRD